MGRGKLAEKTPEAFSSFEIQSIEEGVSILPATDSRRRMIVTIRDLEAKNKRLIEAVKYIRDDLLKHGGEHDIPAVINTVIAETEGE